MLSTYPKQIKIYFRDFPLQGIHPEAIPSAIAARCANEQNHFWEYNNELFSNQDKLNDQTRYSIAQDIGLDLDLYSICIKSDQIAEEIQQEIEDGKKLNVNGTPTFFVNGYRVGGIDLEKIKMIIDKELGK